MNPHKFLGQFVYAFFRAFFTAVLFSIAFSAYLVFSLLMVGGDGGSYWFSHLAISITSFTEVVFECDPEMSLHLTIWSWSVVIFELVFLTYLFQSWDRAQASVKKLAPWFYLVLGFVFIAVNFLIVNHFRSENQSKHHANEVLHQRLTEFVLKNSDIKETVGGDPRVFVSETQAHSKTPYYLLTIYGKEHRYVYVEVQRDQPSAEFRLLCTRAARPQDPFKHPCEQDEQN